MRSQADISQSFEEVGEPRAFVTIMLIGLSALVLMLLYEVAHGARDYHVLRVAAPQIGGQDLFRKSVGSESSEASIYVYHVFDACMQSESSFFRQADPTICGERIERLLQLGPYNQHEKRAAQHVLYTLMWTYRSLPK